MVGNESWVLEERKQDNEGLWSGASSVVWEEKQRIWAFGNLDAAKLKTWSTVMSIRPT